MRAPEQALGEIWKGSERRPTLPNGGVWHRRYGMAWYGMVLYRIVWCVVGLHGVVWYGAV